MNNMVVDITRRKGGNPRELSTATYSYSLRGQRGQRSSLGMSFHISSFGSGPDAEALCRRQLFDWIFRCCAVEKINRNSSEVRQATVSSLTCLILALAAG